MRTVRYTRACTRATICLEASFPTLHHGYADGSTRPRQPRTMFQKIWDDHVVHQEPGPPAIVYIDLHLVHEVTSPQAFDGLRLAGRRVRRPDLTVATPDHNVPTTDRDQPIADPISRQQVDTLRENCREFGIRLYDLHDPRSGHRARDRPGARIHAAGHDDRLRRQPHGDARSVRGFGVRHRHERGGARAGHADAAAVDSPRPWSCASTVGCQPRRDGEGPDSLPDRPADDATAAPGYVLEYTGSAIRALSMEERMTVCNMSIEAGARAGMIAPDATTYDYLRGREFAPADFEAAVARWQQLPSDAGAAMTPVQVFQADDVAPQITWGTNPGQVMAVTDAVPDPAQCADETERKSAAQALDYMGLAARHAGHGDRHRPGLHRLVHERAD